MGLIGNTPLVKIRARFRGEYKNVYAKLEYYNFTGSIKDRVAQRIILDSYKSGALKKGQAIVEATSGNTGISFAGLGALYGHKVYIFMPDWASEERKKLIQMYGGEVIPISKEEGGFQEAIRRGRVFANQIHGFCPNQFENSLNFLAHYQGTACEILEKLKDISAFVSGFGTGGTLMGIGKRIKEERGGKVIALEPHNMVLLGENKRMGEHKIQGIGDDFIPKLLDTSLIDSIEEICDDDAIEMSKMLGAKLGLGVGISSGANFLASLMQEGNVVTVFADDNKKYLSTALSQPLTHKGLASEVEILGMEEI